MRQLIDRWAEKAVITALQRLAHGRLSLITPDGTQVFGGRPGPEATLRVQAPRFFARAVTGGEIGLGESYMDGDWTTPDLVGLVRLMLANRDVLESLPGMAAWVPTLRDTVLHRLRDNTPAGSRRNIREHYDLGNEFFRLFLDANLMYSCARYERPDDSLETAQIQKLRGICEKLQLGPGDHVLEIGTGWGGFAIFAATRYGCRVTTTTISAEQYRYAACRVADCGEAARRIELRLDDYRELEGRFDKIVSIEMFEAVGLRHYDDFFSAVDRLLRPDGIMLLQTITVDDWRFREYRRTPSWISKYIFPGGELASVSEVLASLARTGRMGLFHAESIGTHYARTLHQWRARFHARLDEVRAQGFDDRFIRMWDLYLAFCEAAFLDRHINTVQLLLAKAANRRVLFGEPWQAADAGDQPAVTTTARQVAEPRAR